MQTVAMPESATTSTRTTDAGATIEIAEHLGSVEHLHRGPQVFRSTFAPGHVIDPHFHLGDQFQIFVGGSARIATHRLDPITVHYSDAYTAYGPIICGAEGMTFFNFRARCDLGAEYMPEARKGIRIRGGRTISASCRLGVSEDVRGFRAESVIPADDDGLSAVEFAVGAGAGLPRTLAGGSGLFRLVLGGSLHTLGRELPLHGIVHTPAGEMAADARAGEAGAHVLELQFPAE